MSAKTRRLVAELQAMLTKPDERLVLELIVTAEVRAASGMQRAFPTTAPTLAGALRAFRDLQGETGEKGAAWQATVDRLLRATLQPPSAADPAMVATVRALLSSETPRAGK